jgi:hypothetical protein
VRLGFAVAINVNPSVLLIDEVLAVGDLAFQMKCFDKMAEIRNNGATVVVVSHNLNAVRRMCDHTMVLHNGAQRFFGGTADAINLYHQLLGEEREPDAYDGDAPEMGVVRGLASVDDWQFVGEDPESLTFKATVSLSAEVPDPVFAFSISTTRGVMVYGEGLRGGRSFQPGDAVTFRVRVRNELVAGSYRAGLAIAEADTRENLASASPAHFYAHGHSAAIGVTDLHGTFEIRSSEPTE